MQDSTFERETKDLAEGDYVFIELNQKFLIKQIKDKQKMYEQMQKAQTGSKKGVQPAAVAPGLPANYKIDPPSFVVGTIGELLPSLVYLVEAWEERAKEPAKKAYEHREIKAIKKITPDQRQLALAKIKEA